MGLIRINRNPSGRQLLVFALAWLVFLAALGGRLWHHGSHALAETLWALAVALPAAGSASRSLLRHAYLGLSYAAFPVGYAISHVALALVYYLALTPIGLTMRLLGHDPLARRWDAAAESYWKPREARKSADSYFNQS